MGRAKLRWIELTCRNEDTREQIRATKAFVAMVKACRAKGDTWKFRVVE